MKLILLTAIVSGCFFAPLTFVLSQTNKCGWLPLLQPHHTIGNSIRSDNRYQFNYRLQRPSDTDSIYILPVVVHVIHTGTAVGSAGNPTDSLINAMVEGLNNAWRKNGALYGGADMKIQFQLAVRSPACGATSGINRVNGSSVPNYVSGGITNYNNPASAPEIAIKNLSRWPNTDYINIWIVNKINGSATSPGGYAYFPEFNSALTDGIVLQASVIDGTNKTIVHEMGHVFFLHHTFADGDADTACAANTNCTIQGDLICDTEPILSQVSCPDATNICTGIPFIVNDTAHNYTVLNNYMGYTNCQWMFTQGQKIRARAALFSYRPGLISSGALQTTVFAVPVPACLPSATHGLSEYYGIQQIDFNTLHVYSNSSSADGSHYIDRTCNQGTTLMKGQVYQLSITGSYLNPHRIKAFIDYNNDGDFDDSGETILSDYQPIATASVVVPYTGVITNIPLRLRVIADNPELPEPLACQLHGTATLGAGQAEDYTIVLLKREVFSVSSGAWNNPAIWSCNCIPQNDDLVTIKAMHTIYVTASMGNMQCGKLQLEPTGIINVSGNLFKIIGKD